MKIQVIKKGTSKVKTMSVCPFVVDVPPESEQKGVDGTGRRDRFFCPTLFSFLGDPPI